MARTTKGNSKQWLTALILGALVLIGVIVAVMYHNTPQKKVATPTDYYPKAEEGKGSVRTPSASSTATPSPIPTSTTPKTSSDNKIIISSPTQGQTVKDGTEVSGTATISTGALYYRLKGGQSGQLANGQISVTPGQPTAYSFKLGLTNAVSKGGDQGELEIYTLDANGNVTSSVGVMVYIQGSI